MVAHSSGDLHVWRQKGGIDVINNIKFGRISLQNIEFKKTSFYIYHNLSGNTMIYNNRKLEDWEFFESEVAEVLSHETLHKVLFKFEGSKASNGLDKWCRSRKWLFQDNSGIAFFAKDMGEN